MSHIQSLANGIPRPYRNGARGPRRLRLIALDA